MPMSIGGLTDTSLSLSLLSLSGWIEGPQVTRQFTALPNLLGAAPSAMATASVRQIRYTARLICTSLADREAKLAAYYDAIAGKVPVAFDDHPTRVVWAHAGPVSVAELAPTAHFFQPDVVISSSFIAADSTAYDLEPKIVKCTATPGLVMPGTVPTPGVLFITGAQTTGTPRVITYRSFNGIAYGSLTLTPPATESLGANDYLEVSLLYQTIVKVSAGVRTSVYHWKTAGAFFAPQPGDCDRVRGAYPSITVSTGEAVYVYRPAWSL